MSATDLPFDARTNEVFPINIWVANFEEMAPHRSALIDDVQAMLAQGDRPDLRCSTEPTLQDHTGPHWSTCFAMATTFTDALARSIRPQWHHRSIHSWGTVWSDPAEPRELVDPQVVYQSATYSCLLWLQIPTELEDQGIFALRDPLFAVQERIGSPGYAVVVPKELRMFTFPGFLERFSKPASRDLRWSRPLVWLNIDVCYY